MILSFASMDRENVRQYSILDASNSTLPRFLTMAEKMAENYTRCFEARQELVALVFDKKWCLTSQKVEALFVMRLSR